MIPSLQSVAQGRIDGNGAVDRRSGHRAIHGPPGRRARWSRGPFHRRRVGHLRARQRRRPRPGARGARRDRGHAVLPAPERAGAGPPGRRLRAPPQPAARLCLHLVGRAGRDEHGHRGGRRDRQPHPGPAAAERLLRHPHARPGPPADRAPDRARRERQRRVPAGVALLRPHLAPGAAPRLAARGVPRADRSGRHGGRHDLAARGCPVRGVGLADAVLRAACLARPATAARGRRPGRRDPPHRRLEAAGHRRRRRRDLRRGDGPARRVRDALRHPRPRDAGRQGRPAVEPPDERGPGRHERRAGREPARPRRGPGDLRRHPDGRLRHGLADDLPGPGRDVHRHQRRRDGCPQAARGPGRRRRARGARGARGRARDRRLCRDGDVVPRARHGAQGGVGRDRRRAPGARTTSRATSARPR